MIIVLRIGHRPERDKRVTTHVGLVGRAFGANGMVVDTEDRKMEETLNKVCLEFGGRFPVKTGVNPFSYMWEWKKKGGKIVHLTMYGQRIDDRIKEVRKIKRILVVVGAEKVPGKMYGIADFNLAIGNQPHSEVAALAIFLDRYFSGKELTESFKGRKIIIPCERGKNIIRS